MPPKLNLVIVSSEQFGYHIDTFYYCKYLRDRLCLHFVCWDHGLPKVSLGGVNVTYVSRSGGALRVLRFLKAVGNSLEAVAQGPHVVLIVYMKLISSMLRVCFPRHTYVLDIRTGDVSPNRAIRYCRNAILRLECLLFSNLTVISRGLAKQLCLPEGAEIVPLGAIELCHDKKSMNALHLLYVGTLHNRNMDRAVRAYVRYLRKARLPTKFTIIGAGAGSEEQQLRDLAVSLNAQDSVHVVGRVPHDRLGQYFQEHNVGLSYIPTTSYYDVQPPTKTFEYLLSGMPVLATCTGENEKVISHSNGILIGDSEEEVLEGLCEIERKLSLFDSEIIRHRAQQYRWPNIVNQFHSYISHL